MALGPGEPRVVPVAGRRDRRHYIAGSGIDLVDARLGDLIKVPAIEGGAGVASAVERARGLAALGIEGDQLGPGGGPDPAAVVGDAVYAGGAGEGAILAHDLGRTRRCLGSVFACLVGYRCAHVFLFFGWSRDRGINRWLTVVSLLPARSLLERERGRE